MYGIFTNMCRKNHPNVGKYTSTMEHMGYLMLYSIILCGCYMLTSGGRDGYPPG